MKPRLPGVSVLIAALVLLACALGAGGLVQSSATAPDEQTQVFRVKADPPGSPRTLRRLTAGQRKQARRIVARDTLFRRIVDPHSYRLVRVVPWGVLDERRRLPREILIGVTTQATLDPPKPSVVENWPLVDYPDGKRPDYRIRTMELTVRGLRSVSVYVDLKRRRVASLAPRKADEVIYPPGYKHPSPTGE